MKRNVISIVNVLRQKGCRITSQRQTIIKAILENPNSTCKELFYLVRGEDRRVSQASVYRLVRLLDEHGILAGRLISIATGGKR